MLYFTADATRVNKILWSGVSYYECEIKMGWEKLWVNFPKSSETPNCKEILIELKLNVIC